MTKRSIILVQLPIPPVGPEPIRGNVSLAAGYLKMYAQRHGLEAHYDIDIFPPPLANTLGDQALVAAILDRDPTIVGFTCYLWNIERTLWIAEKIKTHSPETLIVLGGPEITLDNAWVLEHPAIDYAVIGEGEQTFVELLSALLDSDEPVGSIPGLIAIGALSRKRFVAEAAKQPSPLHPFTPSPLHLLTPSPLHPFTPSPLHAFIPRKPLPHLNDISSPYLAGILDAADEQMLLLETIRGCIFKCKFCYYPKSYDDLYFVSEEKIVANLEHARQRGAKEVVLLDPTLNQRRNFPDFLRLLARCNPDRQFSYFGELRAEGITPQVAALLQAAGFTEVEIGLQSIDPLAMELMDRHNNLRSFERGARAMLDLGIKVKVDLIIGLPGDTVDSVRRGIDYIHTSGLYSQVQVFNLAVLPGTSFRQEAEQLGLLYQNRPPYYVLQTPTLSTEQMYDLMAEAEDVFETQFDPLPEVEWPETIGQLSVVRGQLFESVAIQADDLSSNVEGSGFGVQYLGEPADRLAATRSGAIAGTSACSSCSINLDGFTPSPTHPFTPSLLPPAENRTQVFKLHLQSSNFDRQRHRAAEIVEHLLADNPFTTLQIILQPIPPITPSPAYLTLSPAHPFTRSITPATCETILRAALKQPTYLDRFYSVHPGPMKGAKRIIIALPTGQNIAEQRWLNELADQATIVWHSVATETTASLDPHPTSLTLHSH